MTSNRRVQRGDSDNSSMLIDQLRKTDLNLLTALYVLIEERSVTKAAQRMLISQPAMSRVFHRLQDTLQDELLVRIAKKYEPTQHALAVFLELKEILPRYGSVFRKRKFAFNPAKAVGEFRIAVGDFACTVFLPGLVYILANYASGIQIDVVPRRPGFAAIKANEVDLILTPEDPSGFSEGLLRSELLLEETIVCLVRSGHPLLNRRLTFREYAKAQHVSLVTAGGTQQRRGLAWGQQSPSVARALERLGLSLDVRVRVPYYPAVGPIVANTDLIATLPLQVARGLKTERTRIIPAPREFGKVRHFYQVWRARDDSNTVHKWMRGLVRIMSSHMIEELDALPYRRDDKVHGVSEINRSRIDELMREAST